MESISYARVSVAVDLSVKWQAGAATTIPILNRAVTVQHSAPTVGNNDTGSLVGLSDD